MKKYIDYFKKTIRFFVSILASREFAFIYALVGVVSQIAHTFYLTSAISSFHSGFKIFQATLLSAFISSSLLFFVSIVDDSDTKENKRNKLATNIFMIIEILINLYYYSRHLLIESKEVQIFDFIFAVLISGFIPVTIKLYGSQIRAKQWLAQIEDEDSESNINIKQLPADIIDNIMTIIDNKFIEIKNELYGEEKNDDEKINQILISKTEELKQLLLSNMDKDIAGIFQKNQDLFLKQFENKAKMIANNISE